MLSNSQVDKWFIKKKGEVAVRKNKVKILKFKSLITKNRVSYMLLQKT